MSKGVLVFARNNSKIDYIKQAYFLAKSVKSFLNLPTTIVTDSIDYLKITYPDYENVFDKVITIVWKEEDLNENTTLSKTEDHSFRSYYDGTLVSVKLQFKNETRTLAYNITPYDETLILDSDIVILDDTYKYCFEQDHDFLIYDDAYDIANFRNYFDYSYVSDPGIKFYWATVVYFKKTKKNQIFFNLLQHVQENWKYYNSAFQINHHMYRNDHAFSVAIHIMNGYQTGDFSHKMPGKLYYTTDRDICWKIDSNKVFFLLEKETYHGEYTLVKWTDKTIHVMNKFSLNRCIDNLL